MREKTLPKTDVKKILIVEDEGDMCLLLNILLGGEGVTVDHVKTLSAAQEYLAQEEPAVVLLDNRLPDGFGLDFITVLKKEHPGVKIIMISGIDAAAKDIALENGADNFLEKPFTKAQLYESLKGILN